MYLVDDTWAFRFPKRAEGSAWLERDIRIMAVVSDQLGSLVPRFRWFGRPSDAFPYPFVGYRWITGDDADDVPVAGLTGLARELGAALSRLHEIDPLAIPPTPAGWEDRPWSESLVELVGVADLVRPLLSDALREKAEPYLSGRVPPPAPHGSRRFVHNDLCPDHVLVDPVTGRLAGIIDFADAIVGDPVVDFVGLIGIGGRSFVAGVVGHYHHSLGEDFETRFEWLSRVVTLRSLADAAVDAASEVPRHLTWVEHAFRDSEIGDGRLLS